MPKETQCKFDYLSGLSKNEQESFPRQAFRRLWERTAPGNPTALAKELGVEPQSRYTWFTNDKMPVDKFDLLAAKYGFTAAIRTSWDNDSCEGFKKIYEAHWKKELAKPHKKTPSTAQDMQETAFVWRPPTAREQVLTRIEALRLEQLAGVEIGTGHIPLAQHMITFDKAGGTSPDNSNEPAETRLVLRPGETRTKLKLGEKQFASVAFSGLQRNDTSFPWKLGLDVDLGTLDDGLAIRLCSVEVTFSGQATTCEVGQRKRLPRPPDPPDLIVSPETAVRRSKLTIIPHGSGAKQAGWTIEAGKTPIGSFTAHELVEVVSASAGDTATVLLIVPLKGLKGAEEK